MAMKQSRPGKVDNLSNSLGNGRYDGPGHSPKNGRPNHGNSHPSGNGYATNAVKDQSIADPAKTMTELLMSLMRDIFAVDDQAAELPLRQLRVCAMLYEGSRSMSSLSRELGVSLSAMTQIADRLERARLVKRSFEGTDRRVRSLQLTPRAQRIMRLRENSRVQRASAALQQLSPRQRTNVLTTLQALQTACSAKMSNGNGSHRNGSSSSTYNGNANLGHKF
jgi:DNA-binding MarR family transcriptional regulator